MFNFYTCLPHSPYQMIWQEVHNGIWYKSQFLDCVCHNQFEQLKFVGVQGSAKLGDVTLGHLQLSFCIVYSCSGWWCEGLVPSEDLLTELLSSPSHLLMMVTIKKKTCENYLSYLRWLYIQINGVENLLLDYSLEKLVELGSMDSRSLTWSFFNISFWKNRVINSCNYIIRWCLQNLFSVSQATFRKTHKVWAIWGSPSVIVSFSEGLGDEAEKLSCIIVIQEKLYQAWNII